VEGCADAESALRFIETKQVLITSPRVIRQAKVFLQVEGASSNGIIIDGGDLSKAVETLTFQNAAEKSSVKMRG
jgi:hypothetical protein